jgi:hypothetical protein
MRLNEQLVSRLRSTLLKPGVILGILGSIVVVGYSLFAALPYLEGPSLTVHETTTQGLTVISGTTARVSFLSIDGAAVPFSEDGSFSATRAYPPGYTALQVSVTDRFGRTLTKTLTFVTQ